MNENDINDLLNNSLHKSTVSTNFKERLLRDSSNAFSQSRVFHQKLRISGFVSLVIVITTTAFLFGRASVIEKNSEHEIIVQQEDNDNNISVSRDLVAWLDAAKFFTQLGMEQRAEFSYKQASMLIPAELPQNKMADFGQNKVFAIRTEIPGKTDTKYYDNKINRILAQQFGD